MKFFGTEKYIAPIVGGVFDIPFIIFVYIFGKRKNSKENAQSEASKISSNAVLSNSLPSDVDEFLRCHPEYRCLDVIGKFDKWKKSKGNV